MADEDHQMDSAHHKKGVLEKQIKDKKEKLGKKFDKDPVDIDHAKAKYQNAVREYQTAGPDEKATAKDKAQEAINELEKGSKKLMAEPEPKPETKPDEKKEKE